MYISKNSLYVLLIGGGIGGQPHKLLDPPVDVGLDEVGFKGYEVVNVVPIIAKSDSLTLEEREAFKQKVRALPFFRARRVGC